MKIILRWLVIVASLYVAAQLVPGIRVEDSQAWVAFGVMAIVLALVNATIRPILAFLSCGLIIATMGLFMLVINAVTLLLASNISELLGIGFVVEGFWPAFFGSIIVSLVSFALSIFLPDDDRKKEAEINVEIREQDIHYPANGGETPGYLAAPAGEGRYPGVIVIQEWWGLVPHIKDVARRLAREGFVALAPDLYHGQAAEEPDEARKLAMELDRARAVREIQGAVDTLRGMDAVSPKQIGVVGWCMGGSLAVSTAAYGEHIACAVVFYGAPRDEETARQVRAPLLGLYGELDSGIPPERVREFEAALAQQGVVHDFHIYPQAPHAFFNDTRPHIYQPEAAADAWDKTLAWFRRYLGEASASSSTT